MNAQKNSGPTDILETDLPPVGFGQRLRTYFLTGLVVAGPLAITAWLIWSFITWVDDLVRPIIPAMYRPETYLPWKIPGSGLVIAFFALTMLGFLTANLVGRTLVAARRERARPHADRAADLQDREAGLHHAVLEIGNELPQGRPRGISGARHVVAGVPVAAAERGHRKPPAGRRRSDFGIHALHAEPDDRIFLLFAAQENHRTRYSGRGGGDIARVRRHDPAEREWRSEEARFARGHGARPRKWRARPATRNQSSRSRVFQEDFTGAGR